MHELNITEIKILDSIFDGAITPGDISARIGKSLPTISRSISKLEQKGFVEIERKGISHFIRFSSNEFVNYYKELIIKEFPLVECLSGWRMTFLALFTGKINRLSKSDLHLKTGMSPHTIRKYITTAKRYGVLKEVPYGFRISKRMDILRDFLISYAQHISGKMVHSISNEVLVHWKFGFEFIYSVPSGYSSPIGFTTGVTAFSNDNVIIRSQRAYYHYVPFKTKPRKEDYIIDNLLINKAGRQSIMYSLFYYKKYSHEINSKHLAQLSKISGLASLGRDLHHYLHENKDYQDFPEREVFNEKYQMYG